MQNRFSRQELAIGKEAQEKLSSSKVAILGLGALGTVASELLIRAGIGELSIIDRDSIEESNLQRQVLYEESDIGEAKAETSYKKLKRINSKSKINFHVTDINYKNVDLLLDHDLILDCADNLYSRFLVNEFSLKHDIPWIYSAAIKDHGQLMLITKNSACFRCTFEEAKGLETCDTAGIINSSSSCIASLQVNEAIKYLTASKDSREGYLIHLDLASLELSKIKSQKNKSCPACNGVFDYLDGKKEAKILSYQCSDLYQFHIEDLDTAKIKASLEKLGEVKGNKDYVFFKNISLFSNGKVLVRAKDKDHAKADLDKYLA